MKAFPLSVEKNYGQDGMDLRDYFAAKAMTVILEKSFEVIEKSTDEQLKQLYILTCEVSYIIADEMIKVRKQ